MYTLASNYSRAFSCLAWRVQTNIHLISINTLQTKMFYTLPLSLKILLNPCLLSCKQETACKILKSQEVKSSFFFSFTSQCICNFTNTLIWNSFEFWFQLDQVWLIKADEAVPQSYFEQALPAVIFYLVHSRAGLQSNIYSTYGTEDNL